jgi:hypothetical protein
MGSVNARIDVREEVLRKTMARFISDVSAALLKPLSFLKVHPNDLGSFADYG